MSFEIKKHKEDLIFIPLGGAGEIGMNVNLFGYKGKWLMVDLGAGFTDDYYPGVDLVVAELNYISKQKENLLGIVLTHAHEDHLGAVEYLWEELRCPIYGTKFTLNFLKTKLKETSFLKNIKFIEIEENKSFEVGPFLIEPVPLTHSTPEMQSLLIKTELGSIFHTGDWKFDSDPLIGQKTDLEKLKRIGDEGVLALIGDSTNVFNDTHSGSEGELKESIFKLVKECKQAVVVTTFASNVARLETIIKAGVNAGRKIVMAGKSLWRILDAAKSSGYLQDIPEIYKPEKAKDIKRSQLMIISTGCQGEPLAATTKMANRSHPDLRLAPEDTVIFSSKIIPGNEKKIYRLINNLISQDIEVLTEKDHFVHVSGHPSKVELRKMFELLRPETVIPVHGELMHMHEHAKVAKEFGIKKTLQVTNGDVIRIAPDAAIIDKVESGYLGVDGKFLLPSNSGILKMRRRMQESGFVFVILILDDKNKLASKPIIKAPGVLDPHEDQQIFALFSKEISKSLDELLSVPRKLQRSDLVETAARSAVRRVLKHEVGKSPAIDIELIYV